MLSVSEGPVTGKTTQTKRYPGAPHSERSLYKFRNIPYAENSVAGQARFSQSQVSGVCSV